MAATNRATMGGWLLDFGSRFRRSLYASVAALAPHAIGLKTADARLPAWCPTAGGECSRAARAARGHLARSARTPSLSTRAATGVDPWPQCPGG